MDKAGETRRQRFRGPLTGAATRMQISVRLAKVSLALVAFALVCTILGGIPVVNLLLLVAPLAFVVGASGLIASLIPTRRRWIRVLVVLTFIPVVGLNSRIPALLQPLAARVAKFPVDKIELTPDSWVQLESEDDEISGRLYPLAGPKGACSGDGCFVISGFRMPAPGVAGEYWWESPESSLLQRGISLSGAGQPRARLRIARVVTGVRRHAVQITLLDADGKQIGFASEEFRTGLPGEPPDGGDASGIDYLLHANPVAAIAARSARKANPYPVLRFVDGSFVVYYTNVPGLQAVSLSIDAEHPVPAVPATRDGEVYETLFAPHSRASASCDAIFARRLLDDRMFPEVIQAEQGKPSLPIVFARDRSENLVGYLTAQNVAVRCDQESVQAMTNPLWPLGPMRIVEYDRRGVPRAIITADLKNPRGAHSRVDFDSLRIAGHQVSFTRWYSAGKPSQFTHRQDIEIELPRSIQAAPQN